MTGYLLQLDAGSGEAEFVRTHCASDEQAIAQAWRSVAEILRDEDWSHNRSINFRLIVSEAGRPVATVFASAGVGRAL